MKLSAFNELFDGTLTMTKERKIPIPSYMERIDNLREMLFNNLGEEEKEILDDLLFEMAGEESEKENYFFRLGFRYGLTLAMESLLMEVYSPIGESKKDFLRFSELKKKTGTAKKKETTK